MQGPETRRSLLIRLRDTSQSEAWGEFVAIYEPLIHRLARAKGLQHADAQDLTQEVFTAVGKAIDRFDPDSDRGSFRGWLFRIARNLMINFLTRQKDPPGTGDSSVMQLLEEQVSDDGEAATLFGIEYQREVFRWATEQAKPQFQADTWRAFWLTAVEGEPLEEVARMLGKSPGAVRITKGDKVYERMTVTPGNHSVRLGAGQYEVEIEGEHDGLKVENGVVTVTRGDTALVRIVQDDALPAGTVASADGGTTSSEPSLRALEQLQGTWIATNQFGAGPLQRTNESDTVRFTVNGTEFAIELLDSDRNIRTQLRGILSVSAKKVPCLIQLFLQLDRAPQTTLFGEYEIEANHLAITVTAANNPRTLMGPVPAVWKFVRATEVPGSVGTTLNGQGASLEDAVREFNEKCAILERDHGQPPLTVSGLVASVRWAVAFRTKDLSPEQLTGFEFLLNNDRLPHGWIINHSTRMGPTGSEIFQCWSIILRSPGGSHTIRQRLLRQPDRYEDTVAGAARADTDPDAIPLAAAIRQFNDAHMRNPVGKNQPPLTEEEVVAAIRWWTHRRNEAPTTNAEFEAFQQIAQTRSLPKGFEFEVIDHFVPGDGYEYVIWSVRIIMQRTAKPGWTFAFGIRERFISSRLIDDGTIAWGKADRNGLQAGVQFIPPNKQYARGQQVAVRFFLRNTSDRTLEISLPNLMTHAYYEKNHVTAPDGQEIPLRQDAGLGGPVGWRSARIEPDTMQWVNGPPILIGDGALEEGVETAICAEPGQTCCVRYTLPNFADRAGEPLTTGELRFLVTDTAATGPASPGDGSE